jgi:positive regulator of sigma E activity
VPADLRLEPGDIVRLELRPDHLLQAASLAYGLPLLGIVLAVGAASGIADTDNETPVIACGLLGLVAGLMAGRRILRKEGCLQNMMPVAVRHLPAAPAADTG